MKKILFALIFAMLSMTTYAQSKNFSGFSISLDYSLNQITDVSNPGGSITTNNYIPSITADFMTPINEKWLMGVYASYDLSTTDTQGVDPDAQHPLELGVKFGYAATEKLMAYIKLGHVTSRFSAPGAYQTMAGYAYGLGAEYYFTRSIFTRLEWGEQNFGTLYWGDGSTDKVDIRSINLSLGYRF